MNTQMYLRDDPDQQNLIDWIQEGWLQCCGIEGPTVSLIFKNLIPKIIYSMINCHTTIKSLKTWFWRSFLPWSTVQLISIKCCRTGTRTSTSTAAVKQLDLARPAGCHSGYSWFCIFLVISFLICLCFLFNIYICPVPSPVLRCSVSDFLYILFICCTSSVAASPRTTNWSRTSSAAMTSGSRTM